MGRLLKAFLFKITRDLTFRITMIIGVAMALSTTLGLFLIGLLIGGEDAELAKGILNGQSMLINSFNPASNFGLVIPINLISFVALEFNHGTIRNKIIAGNSKLNIYISMLVSGLIFAFAVLTIYIGLTVGISSAIGGFDPYGEGAFLLGGLVKYTPEYLIKMVLIGIVTYVSIVSFTIFIITTFRNMGPAIPTVIVVILILYLIPELISPLQQGLNEMDNHSLDTFVLVARIIDPLYAIASGETKMINELEKVYTVTDATFYTGLANNLVYAGIFFGFGALEFTRRDVK